MADIRGKIEDGFGWWAGEVVRHRFVWILVMLGITALLVTRIPLLEIETSSDDYLFDGDPEKIAYNAFRDQFGRDQLIFVLVDPPAVFDRDFLAWLGRLHRDIEQEVDHLDEVTSLVNIRSVRGRADELVVDDLLEILPETPEELAALQDRALSTPSYIDSVISADGRVTMLQVKAFAYSTVDLEGGELAGFDPYSPQGPRRLLTATENAEFARSLLDVVDRYRDEREDVDLYVTGQPMVSYALTRSMASDVPRIFGGALAIVAVLIVGLFRRLSPVLLSAAVVVLSLLSTLGISQLLGIPISLPTQILPSFMLAVGVGYAVHLLTIFFRAIGETGDRDAAIERALRHVGLPILMTALTTAAGLVSFVVAEMETAMQLGLVGAIGVFVTFAYCIVFLPAVLSLLPFRSGHSLSGLDGGSLLLTACARAAVRHPRKLVAGAVVLALGALSLLPRLDYSADPISYFEEDHWLRRSTDFADTHMGGMQSLELVIDTGRPNGLHEVAVLDRMDRISDLLAELRAEGEPVGRSWSMLEPLKETHLALNEDRPEYYAIPRDRRLIAQELILFENSGADDLESLVDSEFSKARVSILTGWQDGVEKQRFVERARERLEGVMGELAEVSLTGAVVMIARVASASSETLIQSYTLALLLITPLMVILIGSFRAGLISMVPNLIPILATLAMMVVVGIDLDLFTILGACIAIGLAVDDSIHFISGFRRHLAMTGDPERAVELTMESTGRALLFTSVVLVAGFGVLGLSSMANLGYLGLSTAFAIGLAFVLDVTVTPALLVLTHRKQPGRPSGGE